MIYVVRHGQTQLNSRKALQGRSDLPLNDTGRDQARTLAKLFLERGVSFSRVFSSPLVRAVETARLAAPGVPISCDERLAEMDYGPYEGMDLTSPAPEVIEFFSDFVHNPAPEGMEQLSSVVARTGEFVDTLRGLPGDTLVSTHAIAMKGILEHLTPDSHGAYWSTYVGNCAVYAIDEHDGALGVPHEFFPGVGRAGQ
ncbi:MAG: histidine phosphatase family protein [Atopobiaceae bacterium]|nr:histidine phosphatase family protein [Atopobiaceae bacterium]MBQ6649815.1 histidine phosphatase family protein [Atopobiaceae bacterium]